MIVAKQFERSLHRLANLLQRRQRLYQFSILPVNLYNTFSRNEHNDCGMNQSFDKKKKNEAHNNHTLYNDSTRDGFIKARFDS